MTRPDELVPANHDGPRCRVAAPRLRDEPRTCAIVIISRVRTGAPSCRHDCVSSHDRKSGTLLLGSTSDRLAWLALPLSYRWENCRFLVSVFFFDDRLVEADFEAAGDVDACKTSILQNFPTQYGPAQKGEPTFANTVYMIKNSKREIDVIDFGPADNATVLAGLGYLGKGTRSAFGGVPPTPMQRYFGVVFLDPNGPFILTQ